MRANSNHPRLLSALLLGSLALAPLASHAYDLIAPVSLWPVGDVNWKENLIGNGTNIPIPTVGTPLQDGSTTWGEALQKAFDDLNTVLPDHVLTLSLTQNSGIPAGNQDEVNNVAFASTIYGNAWGGSTVGISLSLWTGQRKTENDVLFNSTKTWDSYTGAQQGGITDLRRIALHEFGHSLGLDHPDEAGQVVSAIMNSVSSDIDELQQDDIDGLLSIYGAIMPVTITSHPQSYTTPVGGSWPFSVVATGSELITYDWEQSTNNGASWTDIGFPPHTTTGSFSSLGMGQDGMQIRVNVTNPAGTVTSNVATLTVTALPEAPVITLHPVDANVAAGQNATFTVAASGSTTPTIQWQTSSNNGVDWSNVVNGAILPTASSYSGATTTQLTVSAVAAELDGRMYRAVATNGEGTDTSTAATLTVSGVVTPPSITSHPANVTVVEGEPASFTVAATGTAPLTYQWRKGGLNITGATSATYTINITNALDAGTYTCVVSNAGGSDTSNGATLTVNVPPAITTHPAPQTVTVGAAVSFTVAATGTAPLSYQWRKGGVNISGATSTTYNIAATVTGDAGGYTCVVTNVAGSATTNIATLTVNVPPSVTSHPANKTAVIGSDATFSVTATGTAPLSYQWKRNGANVSGGTSDTLTVTDVQPGAGATYTVVVTNAAGSVTSNPATLALDTTPRLINVSCLASAGSGDSTLVIGFYINGVGEKTLLIRGVGARLAQDPFNLPNTVADPQLRVYEGPTLIATNDDWDSSLAPDFSRMGAFGLVDGSKDAALKITLTAPGLYTVHLVNNGPVADGIIEVYDFSRDTATRLTNVSCRLNMQANQIVTLGTALIANPTPVLARAIGPGLEPYIIEPPSVLLVDPFLRVFVNQVEVASNDNWDSALDPYADAAGAFPIATGSNDAVARVTPSPGSLTIQATGNGGTGVAIIELWESPEP